MSGDRTNDNNIPAHRLSSDGHGHAALLLVESLLHSLIEKSVISVADAVEIVDVAAEIRAESAAEQGDNSEVIRRSITALERISRSLRLDLPSEK